MTISKGDLLVKIDRAKYEQDGTIEPVVKYEGQSVFKVEEYGSGWREHGPAQFVLLSFIK